MKPRAGSVDEYLNGVASPEARSALERLREIIREEAPAAQEVISYGIPTYKQDGFVASFAAFRKHCSFFPGHTVSAFAGELEDFKLSKGTIQFSPSHPIPESLVRRIIRARLGERV